MSAFVVDVILTDGSVETGVLGGWGSGWAELDGRRIDDVAFIDARSDESGGDR